MALQVDIWQRDIQEAFYADIPFLAYGTNVSSFVLEGKVVHIPQAAHIDIGVVQGRDTFPATAQRRTDTDITYTLSSFSTDPFHLPHAESAELSYDKRASLLTHIQKALMDKVSTEILHRWAKGLSGASVLRTSGDSVGATAPSATGHRKRFTEADLARAMTLILNQTKGTAKDMVALVPYNIIGQLIPTESVGLAQTFLTDEERRTGFVARMQNCLILPTYSRLIAQEDGTLKAIDAAAATTDHEVILCWAKPFVEYALGNVRMFESTADPLYYGDVFSFEVRAGGARRRQDNAGVVLIAQDNA